MNEKYKPITSMKEVPEHLRNENALCIAKRGREYIKKRDEGKQHWAQPEACRPAYNAFPLQGNRRKRLCNTT